MGAAWKAVGTVKNGMWFDPTVFRQVNSDDFSGLPTMTVIYVANWIVGRRAKVDPHYTASFMGGFVHKFHGEEGTIVAHSPILCGISGSGSEWYFKPDSGPGMIIPIYAGDVVLLDIDDEE